MQLHMKLLFSTQVMHTQAEYNRAKKGPKQKQKSSGYENITYQGGLDELVKQHGKGQKT